MKKKKKKSVTPKKNGGMRLGAGRPKGSPNKSTAEVRTLVQSIVDFDKLIRSMEKRALKGNHHAWNTLFAYGWGKPPQQVTIKGDENTSYTITVGNADKD